MGIITTLFVGMLSLQTVIGSGGDTLLLKASKFLAGSMIPVIGGTISDALGAAKGCVQLLKGAVGSFGILVAVLTFLPALLQVGMWYLSLKASAWVSSMLGAGGGCKAARVDCAGLLHPAGADRLLCAVDFSLDGTDAPADGRIVCRKRKGGSLMLEAIRQWAASLCFAAAAAGLCEMLAPESGLGRMLKVCVSVFFLCSVLLPLGSLELSFSDWESLLPQQQAQEISRQMQQQSQRAGFEAVQGQLEQEVDNFLRQQGITPVQIRIDMMQQEDSIQMELLLTLEEKDRDREEWLRQNLQSSGLSLQIEYREGDVEDAGGF